MLTALPPIKEVMGGNPIDRSEVVRYGGSGFHNALLQFESEPRRDHHIHPAIGISGAGDHRGGRDKASEHFLEFFAATIRNKNTRAAYVTAVAQFCSWCEDNGLRLATIRPLHVSAHIESKQLTAPSIKQHLAALRGLFNWLVIRQVVPDNPALFVKGPKFSRKVGITPIMEAEQVRVLLDSVPVVRKLKVPKKHGGGLDKLRTSKGCGIGRQLPSWPIPSHG